METGRNRSHRWDRDHKAERRKRLCYSARRRISFRKVDHTTGWARLVEEESRGADRFCVADPIDEIASIDRCREPIHLFAGFLTGGSRPYRPYLSLAVK